MSGQSEIAVQTVTVTPQWEQTATDQRPRRVGAAQSCVIVAASDESRRILHQQYSDAKSVEILPDDSIDVIEQKLAGVTPVDHIVWVAPSPAFNALTDEALITDQYAGVMMCFRLVKALQRLEYEHRTLEFTCVTFNSQAVVANETIDPTHASVHGLIGSMAKEYPWWRVRSLDLDSRYRGPWPSLASAPSDIPGNVWAHRHGDWYRQRLVPSTTPSPPTSAYRRRGVYVVIGGAGGIGGAWSEYVTRRYQAQVVWIGRRQRDDAIQAALDRFADCSSVPHYITADATNRHALDRAHAEIQARYGVIHGIVNSAIVLADSTLARMDERRFASALEAKTTVSVRLAQVFARRPLDFVLSFSSVQSFVKAAGQSNYASGCTFQDAFAYQLGRTWPCRVKVMNWGYWGSVGVVAEERYRKRMARAGIGSIEPPEGMAALEALLTAPINQVAFLKTTRTDALHGLIAGSQ